MATPQEIANAAQAFIEALDALSDAQGEFNFKEQIVQGLVDAQQTAVFDAQAAATLSQATLSAAFAALETAKIDARSTVSGWYDAEAELLAAVAAFATASAELLTAVTGSGGGTP